jgi:hypothetical protein
MEEEKQENNLKDIDEVARSADKIAKSNKVLIEDLEHRYQTQQIQKRTDFLHNIIVPVLSAFVIALATWVWTTSHELTMLRADLEHSKDIFRQQLNLVQGGVSDRYTSEQAYRDKQEVLTQVSQTQVRLRRIESLFMDSVEKSIK